MRVHELVSVQTQADRFCLESQAFLGASTGTVGAKLMAFGIQLEFGDAKDGYIRPLLAHSGFMGHLMAAGSYILTGGPWQGDTVAADWKAIFKNGPTKSVSEATALCRLRVFSRE